MIALCLAHCLFYKAAELSFFVTLVMCRSGPSIKEHNYSLDGQGEREEQQQQQQQQQWCHLGNHKTFRFLMLYACSDSF